VHHFKQHSDIVSHLQPATATSQANRKKLESVFGDNDEDNTETTNSKRKLVPLDYEEDSESSAAQSAEDKKRNIKLLIERIPTAKEELFAYNLEWSIVDQVCWCFCISVY